MERILTNLQVEWLTNIKLLAEYEDDCFYKEDTSRKFRVFVENIYPGQELSIIYELQVLREKGFIELEEEEFPTYATVNYIDITKKGLDYLTMLNEDFAEKLALNEKILTKLNGATPSKDTLDYIEQISNIVSNVTGMIPTVGNFCQGAIPFAKNLKKFKLTK